MTPDEPGTEQKSHDRIVTVGMSQARDSYLTAIIENQPGLIWLKDLQGRFLAVNHAFAVACGREMQDVVGKTDLDIWPRELAEKYMADDARVMQADRPIVVEEIVYDGGEAKWFETFKTPVRDPLGNVIGTTGYARDITGRKRAEEALRKSESRLRVILDSTDDGIMAVDASGKTIFLNRRFAEMWRIPQPVADSADDHAMQIFVLDQLVDPDGFLLKIKQLYGTADFGNDTILFRDGRIFERYSVPMIDDGSAVGRLWSFRDVTERKRAAAERERLTTAIEQAAEMVLVTDAHGDIVYVNPAFEAVTGYARAEVLGLNPRLLKSGKHDDAFYRALWATLSGGETWHGRMINRKKDGALFTQDSTISPVRDAAGVITSYVAVTRDITRDLALEAQFFQSQKMEGIGRLAGGVAHDFNNLLSVILGFTTMAMDRLREGDPLKDELLEVKKAGDRAARLTRQLLAFSRKQVLQPETLDLNRVLTDVEKMLRRIIGEDIDLVQALAPDLGLVRADPGQVEQVIMNLVVNARDAMPEGGKLTIETSNVELDAAYAAEHAGVAPGPYVLIAVTDSGLGMDDQTKANIFEPFFTTKEKGKGTGLGLSTVYGIVKQSGGSISFYSEPGRGSTFKVYLPRELSAGTTTVTLPPAVRNQATGTKTILVAEDEEALRKVARRIVETAGYRVLTAASGEEALLASAQHTGDIHLLLTDVVMPRMGGRVLAQELSKTRPALKVLYMSGYTDDAIVHHGVLDPGTHFISKPFAAADLQRKIREVLDGGH